VIPAYRRFLERFPSLEILAKASNRDVLIVWRGMGYNSRALRLRDAAQAIASVYHGHFPEALIDLLALPGLGHYTAAAVRNFAWDFPTPCMDTNIRRILHRTFYGPELNYGTWPTGDADLLELAADVLECALLQKPSPTSVAIQNGIRRTAAEWHAALMDFGSLVQTKRGPRWDICPLTAVHLMKATPRNMPRVSSIVGRRSEPGRVVAGRFVPNRIFRGKIVEALRDVEGGMPRTAIGRSICIDWEPERAAWLEEILQKLVADKLLQKKGERYSLA
jgi:A/G-specific adenine glycosylase